MRKWLKDFFNSAWVVWAKTEADSRIWIRLNNPWVVVFSLINLILYFFIPLTAVVIFLFSLLGLIFVSWVWAKQMALHVKTQRKLRYAAIQVGDELEETIRLENHGVFPALWVRFDDKSDFPLYNIGSVRGVAAQNFVEWRNHVLCKQRGVFSLGPWTQITSDPFGIFIVAREVFKGEPIFVYPPLATISKNLIPQGKQQGDLRQLNQPLFAETILATHTRQYQAGDPLHHIHWRTTARRESPYVKIFDPQSASRIWLIPDLDQEVHLKNGEESTEETMILLLTALASRFLGEQRRVGLYAAGTHPSIVLPQSGSGYLWNILAALTPLHANQTIDFSEALLRASAIISKKDLVVCITPSLNAAWMHTLSTITNHTGSSQAWALLLDPAQFGEIQHAALVLPVLAGLNITARVIGPQDVRPQEASYGALRRWEFITTATGKAVARNRPRQTGTLPIFRGD